MDSLKLIMDKSKVLSGLSDLNYGYKTAPKRLPGGFVTKWYLVLL